MKKLVGVLLLAGFLASCRGGPDHTALVAARDAWEVMSPEYVAYVEKDPALKEVEKATKKRTAELMTKLLNEATKE